MTRQREIPSLQYRSPNLVNMTLTNLQGYSKFRVNGASRLNDAYGNVAGVGGFGTINMFEVQMGGSFTSKGLQLRRLPGVEESSRNLTKMAFDPDEFTTPMTAIATYLPTDDNVLFVRAQLFNDSLGAYIPEGPILVIPPYDFASTRSPVFTLTAKAPNLGIGAFPPNLPDVLLPTAMNFKLPAYTSTISIANLDPVAGGIPLFFSCHPGMPPTVVQPQQDVTLTGGGVPELFIAAPNGNPWFTIRVAMINSV